MNSLRAQRMAISDPSDSPWSSYRANALGEADPVITPHLEYRGLGTNDAQRQQAYRALFGHPVGDCALESIRQSANPCHVLGSEAFQDRIEYALARRIRPGKPGRPRKHDEADSNSE